MLLPRARTKGLIIEHSADGTLIYDTEHQRAYSLEPLTAAIWTRCDGRTPLEDLAAAGETFGVEAGQDVVDLALTELADAGLISDWERSPASARVSRRTLLKRVAALVGVTSILVPGIAMGR
jgi:hypothetical protein